MTNPIYGDIIVFGFFNNNIGEGGNNVPVIDLLRRNAREHGDEVGLVELNPTMEDTRKISFKEFDLVQQTKNTRYYRRQITWQVFDEKSNRVANMLLDLGIKKGDKVAILMFNCLEWLPIYFGILKTGAIAVPFNFRYTANEISYCADLAEVSKQGRHIPHRLRPPMRLPLAADSRRRM